MTRHRWHASVIRIAECVDGNARSIRCCQRCGMLRITVHPPHGYPWLEFENADGRVLKQAHTPPCEMPAALEAA
jgi:hypothetical protein